MATNVRYGAQIQRELDQVLFYQFRKRGPVSPGIRDGVVLHHMAVEHLGPELERYTQNLHASARHVEIRSFLREPAGRDCYNRVPHSPIVQRCCDNGRVTPAQPRGTNAKKSMVSRPSSMVWTRAEMSTVSPTAPCNAALCTDAGQPPKITRHSRVVELLHDVTARAVNIYLFAFPEVAGAAVSQVGTGRRPVRPAGRGLHIRVRPMARRLLLHRPELCRVRTPSQGPRRALVAANRGIEGSGTCCSRPLPPMGHG